MKITSATEQDMRRDLFANLTKQEKRQLLKMMARIMETAYRRGFQHGGLNRPKVDAIDFRFIKARSLDLSPFAVGPTSMKNPKGARHMTSLERLWTEHSWSLRHVGLDEEGKR
jgi:hypothetical protein